MRIGPLVAALAVGIASLGGGRAARADDAACVAGAEEALALRKKGKLRDALRPLAVCADPACPDEVRTECGQRIAEVRAGLPTLSFVVKDRKGNDLTGVKVSADGSPLEGGLDGRPIPFDPGEHTFRFEVAGQPPLEKKLVLRAGEKDRRETVILGAPPPPPPPGFWTAQRAAAAALTGAGAVGLGVGAVLAAFAASSKSRETKDCAASACIDYPQAVEDYHTAIRNATGSTVAFVAGGVLAATGVVLFVTGRPKVAPPPSSGSGIRTLALSPLLGGSGGGLSLGGSF